MKSNLDIFLKQYQKTRYDVAKITGISEAALSKANRRDPETYTVKLIMALSQTVAISSGATLNQLLQIRDDPHRLMQATTYAEIKQLVHQKEGRFLICGDFSSFLKGVRNASLDDEVNDWFQVGTNGTGTIEMWVITRILTLLTPGENRQLENLKQDIATAYQVHIVDQTTAELSLRILNE